MRTAIKAKGLVKRYGDTIAVNGISFEVEKGSFFCFLGVNGSGKSTTINCICNLLEYDGGEIEIGGGKLSANEVKSSIGVVFQYGKLDLKLSLIENLYCRGVAYGLLKPEIKSRIEELDKLLNFKEFEKRPIERLSGGQRRKCDIARAGWYLSVADVFAAIGGTVLLWLFGSAFSSLINVFINSKGEIESRIIAPVGTELVTLDLISGVEQRRIPKVQFCKDNTQRDNKRGRK